MKTAATPVSKRFKKNDTTPLYSLADYSMVLTGSTRQSIFRLSRPILFSILTAFSLLVWWSPLISTLALALRDSQYTHIFLIVPVSVSLIYLEWKSPESPDESRSSLGFVLLVAAALTTAIARLQIVRLRVDELLSLNMLALVVWWIGSFIVSFGARAFQRAIFPLCFLFWMVPIPEFVLNPIVRLLQAGSAASARLFFAAVGVPVAQDGTQITIPGLTIDVAPECSSIRSSLMLVVTTMILAQMLLGSMWRKALVIAVAIPLSVAKNGLRIFVLAMLTTRVDRSYMTGKLHHEGGILYFLIALAAIFLIIYVTRRSDKNRGVLAEAQR